MKRVMLDTNVFNDILDRHIRLELFIGKVEVFVTHIQRDELNNTKNNPRRADLNRVFLNILDKNIPIESFVLDSSRLGEAKLGRSIPTESAVWDVSNWDKVKWSKEDAVYYRIKARLDHLNGNKDNNVQDALIAETAIANDLVLITRDAHLLQVTSEFSGQVMLLKDLILEIEKEGKLTSRCSGLPNDDHR